VQSLSNILEVWRRASLVNKVLLLAILTACVGGAVLLVTWTSRPNLALLYSNLSPDDAGKISEKLRDEHVQYELRNGGASVYVPEANVYALRLSLASSGLPTGGEQGYRIMDDEKIGASPFTQRVNYIRAIGGELAKTITLLEGVLSARVHVAKPETSMFMGQEKDASATVVLRMRPGWKLSRANVSAVVHLVAGSVEGLKPDKVVVVDDKGTLLSGEGDTDMSKKAGTVLEYKTQVEEYLGRKAEDMLTRVLGPNRATVRVHATIDTSSQTSTLETYDPNARVVTKEEIKSKSGAGGPPDAKTGAAAPGEKEETTVSEYAVGKTVSQKSDLMGKVESLTVAAFVDLSAPEAKPGEPAKETLTIKDAEDIIRNAIGLKTTDTIKIVNAPFHHADAVPPAEAQEQDTSRREFILEIAQRSSLGVLVLGALAVLWFFRRSGKGKVDAAAAGALPALGGGAGSATALATAGGGDVAPDVLRARITSALQENPEAVRRLFQRWVESDKGEL
jgi:flagellar M-ring protein FliF